MRKFQFCSPSFFLLSPSRITENYKVYANIVHTKRLLCYQTSSFSGLGWRMSYDQWATALELSPKMQHALVRHLLGLLFTYSGCGMYSQATPKLLNTPVTGCNEFVTNQLWVSRSQGCSQKAGWVQGFRQSPPTVYKGWWSWFLDSWSHVQLNSKKQ